MKTKINKQSRNLLIALLLGDGTISNNYVFKLAHAEKYKEYLEWKIKQLADSGIKTNGLKTYIKNKGFKPGVPVYYTQMSAKYAFIKVLRRVFYKDKKILGNRKMLNRLDARGIAIWYMDDGHINIRKTNGKVHGFYIKLSLCEPKEEVQTIIDYFNEVWGVKFYMFHEGKKQDSYSLCCGTKEGLKFIDIVKPYVNQVECMKYKIQFDLSQRERILYDMPSWSTHRKCGNGGHSKQSEDIV
jgi:hypothetical protein